MSKHHHSQSKISRPEPSANLQSSFITEIEEKRQINESSQLSQQLSQEMKKELKKPHQMQSQVEAKIVANKKQLDQLTTQRARAIEA